MDNFIIGSGIILLVPFFNTIGVVAPLKNDPILSGRSIWSFRHLELKNLSIISDFRHRSRMAQEFWRRRRRSSRVSSSRSTVLLEDVIILYIIVLYYILLYCIVLYCIILYCILPCCNILYVTILHNCTV